MRGVLININVLLVIVASSYITLGIFNSDRAADLWAIYAIVTFIISAAGLICEYQKNERKWNKDRNHT